MTKRSKRYNQKTDGLTSSSVPLIYLTSYGFWDTIWSSDTSDLGCLRDDLADVFAYNLSKDLRDEE